MIKYDHQNQWMFAAYLINVKRSMIMIHGIVIGSC